MNSNIFDQLERAHLEPPDDKLESCGGCGEMAILSEIFGDDICKSCENEILGDDDDDDSGFFDDDESWVSDTDEGAR